MIDIQAKIDILNALILENEVVIGMLRANECKQEVINEIAKRLKALEDLKHELLLIENSIEFEEE